MLGFDPLNGHPGNPSRRILTYDPGLDGQSETCLEIVGVDFSGAKPDRDTWVAAGLLGPRGLVLRDCRPVRRAELAELLLSLPGDSVAALDFPFSVPEAFARFWEPAAASMPDLWAAAAGMELARFVSLRDGFVARRGEPKRRCDTYFPECYSCLHQVNPNMVPMTFYGMQMLASLWPAGCAVPPLEPRQTEKAVLLEAMPGAVLRTLGLPYKGYKNGRTAGEKRRAIIDGLSSKSGVPLPNLSRFRDQCLASHDCLDAVVAAVTAALWATDPHVFRLPSLESPTSAVALLEGWLYAPVFLQPPGP